MNNVVFARIKRETIFLIMFVLAHPVGLLTLQMWDPEADKTWPAVRRLSHRTTCGLLDLPQISFTLSVEVKVNASLVGLICFTSYSVRARTLLSADAPS